MEGNTNRRREKTDRARGRARNPSRNV